MKVFYCVNFKKENRYLMNKYTMKSIADERRERMNLIKNKEQKDDFFMAELITLDILENEYDIHKPDISGKAGEKPRVNNNKLYFNRSYADENMVIVFDEHGEIGVDCEKILPMDRQVMEFFFTKEEKEYVINSEKKNLAFTKIWTRKESYMKYKGEGLNFQFNLLNTLTDDVNIKTFVVDDTVISVTGAEEAMNAVICLEKREDDENHYRLF